MLFFQEYKYLLWVKVQNILESVIVFLHKFHWYTIFEYASVYILHAKMIGWYTFKTVNTYGSINHNINSVAKLVRLITK